MDVDEQLKELEESTLEIPPLPVKRRKPRGESEGPARIITSSSSTSTSSSLV